MGMLTVTMLCECNPELGLAGAVHNDRHNHARHAICT